MEFAIVATLFFMLVFGIIDFGFAFHSWNNAANAAREGARKAAVSNDTAAIRSRTIAAASTLDPTKLTVRRAVQPWRRRVHHVPGQQPAGWRATSCASS